MMKKNLLIITVLAIALAGLSAADAYSQTKTILALANDYSIALSNYQKQTGRSSIESLLRKGMLVDQQVSEIENLSVADYSSLEKMMKGFVVNREEILFVKPDLKFFAALAKVRGTNADIAYFSLMRQFRPEYVWAAYIEQQTDYSGCTIYGNGVLTKLYGQALDFKKNYPKAYNAEVNEEIDGILERFDEKGCACGSRTGVLREFRLFIRTFPNDKHTPKIRKALAKIERSKGFRFNCESG
jgi:hypothetical protein